MLTAMHFLLLHSPLVTKETWMRLAPSLQEAGHSATVVALDNSTGQHEKLFEHHLAQVGAALSAPGGERIVAVAHSGGGNLLALLDPGLIGAYVFLDAMFPSSESTRFALFDHPAAARRWRELADEHGGMIPRQTLLRFGELITDRRVRRAFIASISDVPIQLYEESIPVHTTWPASRRGLYVQWTQAYSRDAERAQKAGFDVQFDPATHFKMLNQPNEVARTLVDFAQAVHE